MIDTHNGYDNVPAIDVDAYPAIKAHLDIYYDQLEKRYDKGRTPYNLRNCAYHEKFRDEKLLWIQLVNHGRFAYDNDGIYGEASTCILTGECIKFLCAVLNAKLIRWFIEKVAPTSGMGTLQWKKIYVEPLPIPKVSATKQRPLVRLVDRILQTKSANPDADTSDNEVKIDRLVYQLYGLTPLEISSVDERN